MTVTCTHTVYINVIHLLKMRFALCLQFADIFLCLLQAAAFHITQSQIVVNRGKACQAALLFRYALVIEMCLLQIISGITVLSALHIQGTQVTLNPAFHLNQLIFFAIF